MIIYESCRFTFIDTIIRSDSVNITQPLPFLNVQNKIGFFHISDQPKFMIDTTNNFGANL
ncbi:hypothetical protein BpHYR1_033077 [Brachionus plicatilis]|uniref:Uncharacterized protein n=1 Tax=Brachionus plicatilis TaxID=10195 RepID=A0A3M7RJ05_BRAPC|nr:hypothetical protein BpHYR1_033077 [Brachionus plicatilis]